ncbi:MAG: hypothetical protein A2172_03405 [Candidatus Woykebacteria bacterium RBG_13_40_15]|uniref:Uncharacterized protein n=1 Tax=Candidatus Woykebacteria bacterium RBG_13_40_15 TaxID=1802593 RepID=A0A1G1W5R5_9BACT|nr:MAG: hypothetical protein A2172_03405 [Candidatus Woykebacteria bacterium RBG_13_40_15]
MDNKAKILDIAMNLNRIGNWAVDDYDGKKTRIITFLNQTTGYISSIDQSSFNQPFKKTFDRFLLEYSKLEKNAKAGPANTLFWAEQAMTWGNILTHRSITI